MEDLDPIGQTAQSLADTVPSWLEVSVTVGPVPERLPGGFTLNRWLVATDSQALVCLHTGTRLLGTHDRLTIAPAPAATQQELAYLLYSWGTRLAPSLRREFSLHASAFLHADNASALIGQARAGKSTTSLGLRDRGYRPIVDDLLAVRFEAKSTTATCSGWPRPVHVRAQTAAHMTEWHDSPTIGERVRTDSPRLASAITHEVHDVPLVFAIQLRNSKTAKRVTLERLSGAVKLAIIKLAVDRFGQSSFAGRDADFFSWAAGVAKRVPMYCLTRPSEGWTLDQVLDEIEDLLRRLDQDSENRPSPTVDLRIDDQHLEVKATPVTMPNSMVRASLRASAIPLSSHIV